MKKKILITACVLLSSAMTFGAGYQLNLQGLRQLAMGGSGTAWTWDAATIFYNPGGLSDLRGVQVCASALAIMPTVAYAQIPTGSYTTTSQSQTFVPFNLYIGGPLQKGSRWGLGLGVYTPFGSGLKWDDNWTGRYIDQSIYLQSIFVQPTVSYRINNMVSVGAGVIYAFGNVDLKQALPVQDATMADGQATLKGNANGIGYNIGIHLKANDKLQFGFTYRSRVDMKVRSGDATFNVPASLASSFPNTSFTTSLPLPQVASFGVGYRPGHKLTLQLDINMIGWSAYDSLKFDFGQQTSALKNEHFPRLYKNTVAFRLGANYAFSSKFAAMAGAAWDPSPVRDGYVSPELPDADRTVLTCGLTFKPARKFCLMAALEYTVSAKRDGYYDYVNFSGRYQTKAITPGIGLSYDF